MRIVPRSAAYAALLVALGSFGPLTMSIYSPVMPAVGHDLQASPESVKLTLTTFMLGFAVGQLFYGPLSDRYGRRPVLMGGLLFFTVTTFGCSLAPTIGGLIGLRLLQGLGAASGTVLGRALTRDAYTFQEMPLIMSWIALGMNIAPTISPSLGGFLGEAFGWYATFWVVGGFSAILLVVVAVGLGETNKFRSDSIALGRLLGGSGTMLRDPRFLGYVLTLGFAFAINFGMLAGAPFILQDRLGFSPREFGLIVLLNVAGYASGNFANNRLVGRVSSERLLAWAGWFHIAALAVMAILSLSGILEWWAITGPYMVLSFGSGMISPNSSAGAVGLYPKLAGTASSWVGLAQMGMGALGTIVVALLTSLGSRYVAMPLVIGLMPFAVATVLSARLLRRRSPVANVDP
ncbi:MFS transporter, DHA1 family, bicyclomycin/chloramphenicol resistance protein [Enhydrobacter aerosaccus]|uniref:Bcr/CflA family efflux transporter n=1 Tax=Enhydrobacter aerosaccus TaxID=225324 RepID=A0A1T4RHJ2_9HYPH|nr:multidrug effflux MFS transporter [Enhydrobacter aerosaccus]SKA15445.1 MFS transporter, DHA1 family, bicyclomycin/chloramphenicol resistance protein [Enhydrobacter aerosaccus]